MSDILRSKDEVTPVYSTGPKPSATNPKLPKDELEFVRSQDPPVSA